MIIRLSRPRFVSQSILSHDSTHSNKFACLISLHCIRRLYSTGEALKAQADGIKAQTEMLHVSQAKEQPEIEMIDLKLGTTPELPTVAEFERHWLSFFRHQAFDSFELQRGLNNCFSYDMVPPASVIREALRAARRVDSLGTAVRIFGALRDKVSGGKESRDYQEYMKVLAPIREELGIPTPEELGRYE